MSRVTPFRDGPPDRWPDFAPARWARGLLIVTGMRDIYRYSGRLAVGAVVGLVVRASVVVALVALAG
jgi:hypothetical protein